MPKLYILIALSAGVSSMVGTPSLAQDFTLLKNLPPPPESVALIYDPGSGNYALHTGEGVRLTAWEHKSTNNIFVPDGLAETNPPTKLAGLFDVLTEAKLFKLDGDGFSEVDFGPILPAGLNFDDINDDAEVGGSLMTLDPCTILNHCTDPNSPYLFVVPEPSSVALSCIGALLFLRLVPGRHSKSTRRM